MSLIELYHFEGDNLRKIQAEIEALLVLLAKPSAVTTSNRFACKPVLALKSSSPAKTTTGP